MRALAAVTFLLACLAASAQTGLPPPSTGRELPPPSRRRVPTEAEARPELEKVLADARSPKRDCAKLISPWTRLLLAVVRPKAPEVVKDLEGYLWLSRCAEKQRYYVLMGDIGELMLGAAPERGHPELLARAMLGLNSPQAALRVLEKAQAIAAYAKDPDVNLTTAKALCRVREWARCLTTADQTIKLVKKPTSPEGKEVLNRAQKYRARALLHTGKLEDAAKAVALSEKLGGDAEDLGQVRKALVPARTWRAVVETDHQPLVPLGIFHLMGKKGGARGLVRFYVDNVGEDRQFRVEASIDGVTTTQSRTETILKGQGAVVELTPPLSPDFDLLGLRAARSAQLNLKVIAVGAKGEQVVFQDSSELELKPRDFLPTASFVDEEKARNESHALYMAAWVTPNGKTVEAFLTEAKQRAPRSTFSGEQAATIPQVRALFDTLKARGVSYVMNPETLSGTGYGQRARLPAEVLSTTNAQCLEGAILYATLMEAIGLQPAIILVPGHAFVAWRTSPGDAPFTAPPPLLTRPRSPRSDGGALDSGELAVDAGPAEALDAGGGGEDGGATDGGRPGPNPFLRGRAGRYLYLETTMTHDATFEEAVTVGGREFDLASMAFRARVLVLPELRKLGIAPQPYE